MIVNGSSREDWWRNGYVQPHKDQEVGARLKTIFNSPIPHHLDPVGLGYSFYTQHKSGAKKLPFQK